MLSLGSSDTCNQAVCLQRYSRLLHWSFCEGDEAHMHQESLHSHCKITMHAPCYMCTGKHITDTLTTRSSTTTLSKGLLNKASSCLLLLALLTMALSGKLYPKVNSVFQPPYKGNLGRISACTLLGPNLQIGVCYSQCHAAICFYVTQARQNVLHLMGTLQLRYAAMERPNSRLCQCVSNKLT